MLRADIYIVFLLGTRIARLGAIVILNEKKKGKKNVDSVNGFINIYNKRYVICWIGCLVLALSDNNR